MSEELTFPLRLEDDENGTVIASVEGVPEAITVGRTSAEAIARAQDALVAALRGYVEDGRPVPVAASALPGQPTVGVPPLAAAKLALYAAMRREGLNEVALAERLRLAPTDVRHLLDLDDDSRLELLDRALAAFGKALEIRVVDAA